MSRIWLALVLVACGSGTAARTTPQSDPAEAEAESPFRPIVPERLAALRTRAAEEHSDALIVLQGGEPVLEDYFGGEASEQIQIMSVSKIVGTSLTVRALTLGRIESIDEPLGGVIEAWAEDERGAITLRQLLGHDSGLDPSYRLFDEQTPNDIRTAAAEIQALYPPDRIAAYNNFASNLIGLVLQEMLDEPLAEFAQRELFSPLGIEGVSWQTDEANVPRIAGGCRMRPRELAPLGELWRNGGVHRGTRLLAEEWVRESLEPATDYHRLWGLGWWRLEESEAAFTSGSLERARLRGVDTAAVSVAEGLIGRRFADFDELREHVVGMGEAGAPLAALFEDPQNRWRPDRIATAPMRGFHSEGFLGQYLVVLPADGIVAVRMRAWYEGVDPMTDGFDGFREAIEALVEPGEAQPREAAGESATPPES